MSATKSTKFFDESEEQSIVKATIVEKYFLAWAKIIVATQKRYPQYAQKVGYVDLFAGPGRYKDGSISTPLRILNNALEDSDLCERLVTIFNDKEPAHTSSLIEAIKSLDNISSLKYEPQIYNDEVGEKIAKNLENTSTIPLLAFIDPWGYKGLSLRLVDAFLKDWGCDCIFFFNYSRINAGLSNPKVRAHMEALFGSYTQKLIEKLTDMTAREREATIVETLAQSLKSFGHRFVMPFCFKNESGRRTTHHLIFVTKDFKGYEVMKDTMAKMSSTKDQGVPSFEFCPAINRQQSLLFSLGRPLEDLESLLLKTYSGRTMKMIDIYRDHCIDTPYIKENYKEVLKKMENDGTVLTAGRRSNRGFADDIRVTFPD